MGELVNSPISTSEGPKPVKLKSKFKTKIGLVEEGGITIRGTTARILISEKNEAFDQ